MYTSVPKLLQLVLVLALPKKSKRYLNWAHWRTTVSLQTPCNPSVQARQRDPQLWVGKMTWVMTWPLSSYATLPTLKQRSTPNPDGALCGSDAW